MDVKIDPRAEARRIRGIDWQAVAWRVMQAPMTSESHESGVITRPGWIVVMHDGETVLKGRASYVKSQLRCYGVLAEVRAMKGVPGSRDRNWEGWVTFARLAI